MFKEIYDTNCNLIGTETYISAQKEMRYLALEDKVGPIDQLKKIQ